MLRQAGIRRLARNALRTGPAEARCAPARRYAARLPAARLSRFTDPFSEHAEQSRIHSSGGRYRRTGQRIGQFYSSGRRFRRLPRGIRRRDARRLALYRQAPRDARLGGGASIWACLRALRRLAPDSFWIRLFGSQASSRVCRKNCARALSRAERTCLNSAHSASL